MRVSYNELTDPSMLPWRVLRTSVPPRRRRFSGPAGTFLCQAVRSGGCPWAALLSCSNCADAI